MGRPTRFEQIAARGNDTAVDAALAAPAHNNGRPARRARPVDKMRLDRINTSSLSVHVPTSLHRAVKIHAVRVGMTQSEMLIGWIKEKLNEAGAAAT